MRRTLCRTVRRTVCRTGAAGGRIQKEGAGNTIGLHGRLRRRRRSTCVCVCAGTEDGKYVREMNGASALALLLLLLLLPVLLLQLPCALWLYC